MRRAHDVGTWLTAWDDIVEIELSTARLTFDQCDGLVRFGDHPEEREGLGPDEAVPDAVVEHGEHRVEIVIDVDKYDRFVMFADDA